MLFLSTKRILKFSWQHFWRNIWLSFVTMTIIVLTLISLTTLILINAITEQAVQSVKDNIDVSLYFDNEITEEAVMLLQNELQKIDEVDGIIYVSPDEALTRFQDKHAEDKDIQETLAELEENPLGPTLVLIARDVEEYPVIMEKIKNMEVWDLAEKIDYDDQRFLVGRINDFASRLNNFALALSVVFLVIALLTVFNTIRMGIYVHRREIGIMRLVGASNWFIRMPFVIEGLLYSIFGCLVFWGVVFLGLYFVGDWLNAFFSGINFSVAGYLQSNILMVAGAEFLVIAFVNIVSASLAMGKYLRV